MDTEQEPGQGGNLATPDSAERTRWRFDRYEFDPAQRELVVDGRRRTLEDRVAAVLLCLLEHADQVVSRPTLLASAWAGQVVTDGAIAKAIMKLRAALGVPAGHLLLSVHGIGYRLAVAATRDQTQANPDTLHLHVGARLAQRPYWCVVDRWAWEEADACWQLRHEKTGEMRLLCIAAPGAEAQRLSACIAAHTRLLHALPHRSDLSRLVEANDARAPVSAEFTAPGSAHLGGGEVGSWLEQADLPCRLALACAIVDAVAAAHSAGVGHGWLRAEHVLLRLADSGQPSIALWGFSAATTAEVSARDWHAAVLRDDVQRLGRVVLCIACGDLNADCSPGWERRIDDPLLCEDIALACDADPSRRPRDAVELARLLHSHPERRRQRAALAVERAALAEQQRALARAQRRWRLAALVVLVTTLFSAVCVFLLHQAQQARDTARQAQATSQAINEFLIDDLIGKAEPFYGLGIDVRLLDVIVAAEASIDARFGAQPLIGAEVALTLGRIHLGLGLWDRAEALLERSLELAGSGWAREHPQRLLADFNLGDLLVRRARFVEAREVYRRVLESQDERRSESYPDIWWTRTQLAWIEHELGNSALAARELQAVLDELSTREFAPALWDLSEHYLALAEHELGLLQESAQRFQRLRERVATWRGETHPATAQVDRNMGALWVDLGHAQEAAGLLEPALTTMIQRVGAEHPEVYAVQSELGAALLEAGHIDAALAMLAKAAKGRLAVLGIEHDRTRHTLSRKSQALYQAGDHDAALLLATQTLAASEAHLGSAHPESALFRFRYAQLLAASGAVEAAYEATVMALADTEQHYGAAHPRSLAMRVQLIEWDLAAERVSAAQARYTGLPGEALATLPERHPVHTAFSRVQADLVPVPAVSPR